MPLRTPMIHQNDSELPCLPPSCVAILEDRRIWGILGSIGAEKKKDGGIPRPIDLFGTQWQEVGMRHPPTLPSMEQPEC